MSCAICMRRAAMPVDLVEIDPNWKIYRAGITITGPTLRLGEIEMNHGSAQEHTHIMIHSMTQLRQPA